jgi:hypothetical protein
MRICVFCGSSAGHNPVYANAARETGRTIAARGMDLVYGRGRVGLMGALADAALGAGGVVIGVMPLLPSESPMAALERELREELGCAVRPGSPVFLGTFTAEAANEGGVSSRRRCIESSCSAASTSVRKSKRQSGSTPAAPARSSSHL